jgi:autotransporter passenger strand-loop-strand repeat protein
MTTYTVSGGTTVPNLVASGGDMITVLSGGTITGATVLSGGSATVSSGGVDSGSTVSSGGSELVYGSATGDSIAGTQIVSSAGGTAGVVSNETILSGGVVSMAIKGTSAANITVDSGGFIGINGSISGTNLVLSGGTVELQSAKATLTGALTFAAGGDLEVGGNTSAGSGDLAIISGFAAGDIIDILSGTAIASGTSPNFTTATSGGNTVVTVSGGTATDTFIFAGTSIGSTLALVSDNSGGYDLEVSGTTSAVTSVGSGATASNVAVSSGSPLTVYNGGTIVNATISSGGTAIISGGGVDVGATVRAGGSETVLGSASGDTVYGSQVLSGGNAVATSETLQSGGTVSLAASGATISGAVVSSGATLALSGGGTAVNTTIAGGTVILQTAQDTLSGSLAFNGPGTLDIAVPGATGDGVQAAISGFYSGDAINIAAFGSGATLSTSISGGNTIATITSGGASEVLTFSGTAAANLALATSGGTAQLDYAGPPTTTSYTPGDLVLSIYGDGSGTGSYTLDQAAPITLEEITTTGQIVSDQELPQTTTLANGGIEYAISGEYESASEGILTLSADGRSLVIAGYGVTATSFDAANAASIYGTSALGQTTSLLGGQYTAVERVVADISYNTTVDTSTSLSGIFNTNNPRSVYTINGTTFYLSGQGNGNDGTEGVFVANDGASTATAIYNTKTDTREVAIYNGELYVSVDSKSNNGAGIYNFGASLPTGATAPTELQGLGASITLTAAQENSVNSGSVGTSVNLSPEQYFFANANTLYVADGGDPKEGGVGDGGLQKWVFANGVWTLEYTLSQGLNLINSTSASTGTTGLVGLTGTVEGANVILYATNETVAETDQTYLYGITDTLAATSGTGESFTLLETAAPDTLIRGVAFAPTSSATTPEISTTVLVSGGASSGGLTFASGGTAIVLSGGTIAGTTLLSAGSATVSSGGFDSATFVAHGANELVLGSAAFDIIDGTQTISNATAVVSGEVVENGGSVNLFLKGGIATATTVNTGGGVFISGNAYATNTVINGGSVVLESAKAVISGTLTFSGTGGTLRETVLVSATSGSTVYGNAAVISGFGATDAIDERAMGSGATLATTSSGGTVFATITSGGTSETFALAGSNGVSGSTYASGLSLVGDNSGGVEILYTPPAPINVIVSGGTTSSGLSVTSANSITVLSGGTMTNIMVSNGGSAVISAGGEDLGSTILAGGSETVDGDANGDQIYGVQNVTTGPGAGASAATVENETVFNGGTVELFLKPDIGSNITVSSGGSLLLSGNVSATNTTLEAGGFMALESPKAVIYGGLTFVGAATIDITAVTSSGFGGSASLISGWGAGDVIDETLLSAGSASLSVVTSGGNTVATITGATYPDVFVFSGTAVASQIALGADGNGAAELIFQAACLAEGTLIRTETGERPIETLRVGERVVTASGAARPIIWTGHRGVAPHRHPRPHDVMPVRVRAHAVAPGCPARDLLLSPDHAVFLDGVLIPVRHLVNGASIAQEDADRITWWHVELETHDVILAEGLPTESYLDTGNRAAFVNGGASVRMHPAFARTAEGAWAAEGCAPLVEEGEVLERVRARLAARVPGLGIAPPRVRDVLVREVGLVSAVVPADVTVLRLVSPSGRAGQDRRRLGALIQSVRVDGETVPLDDPRFGLGFHEVELHGARPVRWTDGAAMVALGHAVRPRAIEIDIAAVTAEAAAA